LLLVTLAGINTASAATEHSFVRSFGEPCSVEPCVGAELKEPVGVAVDDTSEEIYVVDRGANRVVVFDASGAFVSEFAAVGAPAGPLSSPTFVAVDNSDNPLDPSAGDVYVLDAGHDAIDKFDANGVYLGGTGGTEGSVFGELDGVDVDSAGKLWVYQASGEIDDFGNDLANKFIATRESPFGTSPGFAVDSGDHLYVNRGAEVIAKLDETGFSLIEELDGERTTAAAADLSNDDVYVDNVETIARFDSSGRPVERFGGGNLASSDGVAVDASSGTVYASQSSGTVDEFDSVVVPDARTAEALAGETSATLNGYVNPDGIEVSSCEFEYGRSSEYEASAPCAQSSGEIGAGGAPVPVSTTITGLEALKTYHYRLTVSNANGTSHGQDATFITPSKPVVKGESVLEVNATDATLQADVGAGGRQTTYTFEYGMSASYGNSAPVPSAGAGMGLVDVAVNVKLQHLQPASAYHFRVVATNELGSTDGMDQTFTTPPLAQPLSLPDGRGWEMVSPPEKHGGLVEPLLLEGAVQAAASGDAFTFLSEQSLFSEARGAPTFAQVLARRSSSGWIAEDIATPHDSPSGQGVGQGQEYRLFSSELARAAVEPFGPFTPLAPQATERTPYIRDNETGVFTPLLTPADVTNSAKFEGNPTRSQGPVRLLAATPDLTHAILHAEGAVPLTSPPTNGGLYEWSPEGLQLVSVLPGEAPIPGALGFDNQETRNAISADGSRVFWEGEATVEEVSATHLFVRQTIKGETLQIDVPAPGASGAGIAAPIFQGATPDGSKVFFTDEQALTQGATASLNRPDLYECELVESGGKLSCDLSDLTVPVAGEAAEVSGFVLGTSDDGSYVYWSPTAYSTNSPTKTAKARWQGLTTSTYCTTPAARGGQPSSRLFPHRRKSSGSSWNGWRRVSRPTVATSRSCPSAASPAMTTPTRAPGGPTTRCSSTTQRAVRTCAARRAIHRVPDPWGRSRKAPR
jgi:DNA-binding beta-propeller fold protein YncE